MSGCRRRALVRWSLLSWSPLPSPCRSFDPAVQVPPPPIKTSLGTAKVTKTSLKKSASAALDQSPVHRFADRQPTGISPRTQRWTCWTCFHCPVFPPAACNAPCNLESNPSRLPPQPIPKPGSARVIIANLPGLPSTSRAALNRSAPAAQSFSLSCLSPFPPKPAP